MIDASGYTVLRDALERLRDELVEADADDAAVVLPVVTLALLTALASIDARLDRILRRLGEP